MTGADALAAIPGLVVAPFVAALAFSGHCAAMCGVFPTTLRSGAAPFRTALSIQALYHAGKISTYVFLGAIAAAAGARLAEWRRPLGVASGLFLLLVGVATLIPAAVPKATLRWIRGSPLCSMLADVVRRPGAAAALSTGVFNGFIPCGLVYGMAARAATLGSVGAGALSMFAFGLGTVPSLLVVGLAAGKFEARFQSEGARRRLSWAAGGASILLGVLTIVGALSGSFHDHAMPG